MSKIVVLGCGMVGRVVAQDLSDGHDVTAVDVSDRSLARLAGTRVRGLRADLADPARVRDAVAGADLVVGAVPGFMGFATLRTVIEAGRNVVDISFFPEEAFDLDEAARAKGVTAVVDCGVAPGMSNLVLGHHLAGMTVQDFRCYVGGLPVRRDYPFEYKAPFSPADVIEEYVRPARYVENGHVVVKPALSDPELMRFPEVGTLEAFNSDGLRSLLRTAAVPRMIEKTLRYPGHIEYIRALRETGFFSREPLDVGGARVRPLDVTSMILFRDWKLHEDDDEFTIMRMVVAGEEAERQVTYTYDLFDRRDPETGFSSMARTTGFPAAAAARLVVEGRFRRPGICPPEFIGGDEDAFRFMFAYQEARNVRYRVTRT